MKKALSYRLFRLGAVPRQLLRALKQEGIIVLDEGVRGRFIARHANASGKCYRYRREGFSGWLAITNERVMAYTYRKRQINISSKDPGISRLFVDIPRDNRLSISFESSNFRKDWEGRLEFQFDTQKAVLFRDTLLAIGAQSGVAV